MVITLLVLEVTIDSPWAVAAPELAGRIDRPMATDGHGHPYLPASSLAGSLRDHLGQRATELMGGPTENDDEDDGELAPSPLQLLGTRLDLPGPPTLVRSTAIDRHRSAAKPKTLRSAQTGPAGTRAWLFARYDQPATHDLLDLLASWQPAVGGRRTGGLGRARLTGLRWGTLDLTVRDDLRRWLLLGGPALFEAVATQQHAIPQQQAAPWLRLGWRIVDGLLVGVGTDRAATRAWRRDGRPCIEGTSLKGVLRSRAEFILASRGEPVCHTAAGGCGTCLACVLFGAAERRGRLAVRTAPIEHARVERWPHVAIDRVTGGSAHHRLFEEEVVVAGRFDLVIDALDTPLPAAARRLVLSVCADLNDGLCGLGGRTSRGLGTIELEDPAALAGLDQTATSDQDSAEPDPC